MHVSERELQLTYEFINEHYDLWDMRLSICFALADSTNTMRGHFYALNAGAPHFTAKLFVPKE